MANELRVVLERRLIDLNNQFEEVSNRIVNETANLNALYGAIQVVTQVLAVPVETLAPPDTPTTD